MPLALLAACAGLFGFFAPLTAGASLMAGDGGVAICGVSPMATWWSRFAIARRVADRRSGLAAAGP
jgi:hypothetical protein